MGARILSSRPPPAVGSRCPDHPPLADRVQVGLSRVDRLLLRELQRRTETVRVSHAKRNLAQPAKGPHNPTQNHDRLVLLWPARRADRQVDNRSESGGDDTGPMPST
jgi:hypothetical protein